MMKMEVETENKEDVAPDRQTPASQQRWRRAKRFVYLSPSARPPGRDQPPHTPPAPRIRRCHIKHRPHAEEGDAERSQKEKEEQ